MIYADKPISVQDLKEEVSEHQQKNKVFSFLYFFAFWTSVRNWLEYLWIKF